MLLQGEIRHKIGFEMLDIDFSDCEHKDCKWCQAGKMFFTIMEAVQKSGVSCEVSKDDAVNGYIMAYFQLKEENAALQRRIKELEKK